MSSFFFFSSLKCVIITSKAGETMQINWWSLAVHCSHHDHNHNKLAAAHNRPCRCSRTISSISSTSHQHGKVYRSHTNTSRGNSSDCASNALLCFPWSHGSQRSFTHSSICHTTLFTFTFLLLPLLVIQNSFREHRRRRAYFAASQLGLWQGKKINDRVRAARSHQEATDEGAHAM